MNLLMLPSRILTRLGHLYIRISRKLYESPQHRTVGRWFQDEGDTTLRLDYDLAADSMVFDLGGYEGQWASDIFAMYCCTIHVFEPVAEFAERIRQRFAKNDKVVVHQFGLSKANRMVQISVNRDSSSFYRRGDDLRDARMVRAADFINENNIGLVDLMKINIEGAEYELLEHLIDFQLVKRIRSIQVQFHDFVPNAEERMASIQNELKRTHRLSYQYLFVWENWTLR